jgi:UV DNA damage repair endonuclease
LDDLDIRIAIYLKSKNHIISTDLDSKKNAKQEILKIGKVIEEIDGGRFDIPLICHIGGAKGNRRKSMQDFCKFFDSLPWRIQKSICLINDDKPSLYSVKDLLSVTYIEKKIPIIFRTSSHRTNQGGLTYKESFFLAASTWAERSNPILFYCPSTKEETVNIKDLNPYNLMVDVAFDNNLPEPI